MAGATRRYLAIIVAIALGVLSCSGGSGNGGSGTGNGTLVVASEAAAAVQHDSDNANSLHRTDGHGESSHEVDLAVSPTPGTGEAIGAGTEIPAGCSEMFDNELVEHLSETHPGSRFTAAVHDHRTGCEYHLHPNVEITTASVIKAQILAGLLLQSQREQRPLTHSETANVELMMRFSHNYPPTSALYVAVGGAAGMEQLDRAFGISGTTHTSTYGATLSTAEDRTVLVAQLLIGGGPLNEHSREQAWEWMSNVTAAQSWGVTAGLPAGFEAALKNGFYPTAGAQWRLGTTGAVRDPNGGSYAMTIMTDNNPTESAGIALVEEIARHINSRLAPGPEAPRAADEVHCVEPPSGSTWAAAADHLGGIEAEALRHLNGGESHPLSGQRICRPIVLE